MPRINQLPTASSVASTDVVAIDTQDKTYRVPKSTLFDGYYTAAEVDAAIAQSTAKDNLDLSSKTAIATDVFTLTSGVYRCSSSAPNLPVNGSGYITVIYRANDTRCLEYMTDSGRFFTNTLYNGTWTGWKEYEDKQSTAWANNWITNKTILQYAASVANPSFTTFRTSATSTDVPIANEYYIGTVERYGQNITVKMTTMQDASKMYINNSVNGGSTWTGWQLYNSSVNTPYSIETISESSVIDFDDIWQYGNGIYSIKIPANSTSKPVAGTEAEYWYVFQATFYANHTYGIQIASRSINSTNVYMRKRTNGTNGSWSRITFNAYQ